MAASGNHKEKTKKSKAIRTHIEYNCLGEIGMDRKINKNQTNFQLSTCHPLTDSSINLQHLRNLSNIDVIKGNTHSL